jgi:hypothetical protein
VSSKKPVIALIGLTSDDVWWAVGCLNADARIRAEWRSTDRDVAGTKALIVNDPTTPPELISILSDIGDMPTYRELDIIAENPNWVRLLLSVNDTRVVKHINTMIDTVTLGDSITVPYPLSSLENISRIDFKIFLDQNIEEIRKDYLNFMGKKFGQVSFDIRLQQLNDIKSKFVEGVDSRFSLNNDRDLIERFEDLSAFQRTLVERYYA